LSIDFNKGLSIITGETGAGKSILLGALGLVLGNRADLSSLKDTSKKCVVEAELAISNYNLEAFFNSVDLDYEAQTIIRREILPSGKSRAFVNDTPVKLSVLTELKGKLIDVHSQHQTLELSDASFQFHIIDVLAKNEQNLASYQRGLKQLSVYQKEFQELEAKQREANQQYDYNLHLYNELTEANLKPDEQEELEEKFEKLNNVEDIQLNLSEAVNIVSAEEIGIQTLLNTLENRLQKIALFSKEYQELSNRITSIKIELDDIVAELEDANDSIDSNPNELEKLNDRLQLLYNLQKKHYVSSVPELLEIQEELSEKVDQVENAEEIIKQKQQQINDVSAKLDEVAILISNARKKILPNLKKKLEYLLSELGMPEARSSIELSTSKSFLSN